MQRLKALEQNLEIDGITDVLRNLAIKQTAVWKEGDINIRSLHAIKSKLKTKEGIILKAKTRQGNVMVKRLF